MASPTGAAEPGTEQLRQVLEVVGLWLQMQARLESHFGALAAEHSLSPIQAKLLVSLDPETPVSARALADRLRYDPSNLTTVIDRLEERGAVRRQPNQHDRRVKGLLLTDEGVRLRQAFWHRLDNDAGPMDHLTSDELTRLRDVLRTALGV